MSFPESGKILILQRLAHYASKSGNGGKAIFIECH
jgi:hypothetical protein